MRDLIVSGSIARACPQVAEGIRRIEALFEGIKSFEDVEAAFLKGAGLSRNTYAAYLTSVRSFYHFTGGLNPLQVTAAHMESWYDFMLAGGAERNTARLRIASLKSFFLGVERVVGIFRSPFRDMPARLVKKLSRTKKPRTRGALTRSEVKGILEMLRADDSPEGWETLAIFTFLLTSGLRAAELCSLRWSDLNFNDETGWSAHFVQKGGDSAEQEIHHLAVKLSREAFRARFRRDPRLDDALFSTRPRFHGDVVRPLGYRSLRERIIGIERAGRKAGVLARDLAIRPHTMRRTFATLLVKGGMDLKSVQTLTRHASIEVLCRHYVDSAARSAPTFDGILGVVA